MGEEEEDRDDEDELKKEIFLRGGDLFSFSFSFSFFRIIEAKESVDLRFFCIVHFFDHTPLFEKKISDKQPKKKKMVKEVVFFATEKPPEKENFFSGI